MISRMLKRVEWKKRKIRVREKKKRVEKKVEGVRNTKKVRVK